MTRVYSNFLRHTEDINRDLLWNFKLKKRSNSPLGHLVKDVTVRSKSIIIIALMYASIDLEEIQCVRQIYLFYSIGVTLHMSSSYHPTYIYLISIQVLWSRHLKSYLSILGENQSYPPYLVTYKLYR